MSEGAATDKPRYEQELHRELGLIGNVVLVLSGVTPASSVFIIVPFIILTAGTGAFLAMLFAAVIGVFMAFCWAELTTAFPIAGGDYALVWHAFKGRWARAGGPLSMAMFALMVATAATIPAVIALGTSQYIAGVVSVDTRIAGAAVCLAAGAIALLRIRMNAWITGVFLALELLALLVLTVLGIVNIQPDRASLLFSGWVVGDATTGALNPVTFGIILTATATGIFAYNGYNSAVYYSEETKGPSRGLAVAILWALVITVAAELIPTTAVLLGAPDLAAITSSATPMTDFLEATANDTITTLVSLGVALAIFNATIAIVLSSGRIIYSSARDRAWPGVINTWLASVHKENHVPWVATALVGVLGALLAFTVDLNTLIAITGADLVAWYWLITVAAIVGRVSGATTTAPYRMPLWPLPPILAFLGTGFVALQQTQQSLLVTGATVVIGLAYWAVFIRPQGGRAWNLREPLRDETVEEPMPVKAATT
jgi:amino acid transporter